MFELFILPFKYGLSVLKFSRELGIFCYLAFRYSHLVKADSNDTYKAANAKVKAFSILPTVPRVYTEFSILPTIPRAYKAFRILPTVPRAYKAFSILPTVPRAYTEESTAKYFRSPSHQNFPIAATKYDNV